MASLRSDIQIAPQDLFTSSTTQNGDLGARATTGDGRYFRLVQAGSTTALISGNLCQNAAQNTGLQNLSIAAAAVGATSVTTTSTVTLAANQLAGGVLSVRHAPGAGYQYRIKSHPAVTAAVVTFQLDTNESIQVALTTSSKIDVLPSIYSGCIISATTLTGIPVGVVVGSIPALSYGWVQTHGPASVLIDATAPTVGLSVVPSPATAGAVAAASGTGAVVGYAMVSTTSAELQPVFLTID